MKSIWPCLLVVAILSCADALAAVPAGADRFKDEAYRTLTAEIVLPYHEKTYAKPVELRLLADPARSEFDTPESALQTFFSSLAAGDVAWNDRCWTEAARRFNKKKDAEEKRPADYWPQRWMRTYAGKRIELHKRIEYSRFVIIEYTVQEPSISQPVEQDTLALMQVGGKWLLTQDLGRNPIMFVTKAPPTGRIQLGPSVFDSSAGDSR